MNADELSQSKPDSERDESTLLLGDQSPTREEGEAMSPLDLFIRDLDEKRGKIPCCQEVTDIQTGVENVFKDFLLEVEKENPFLKTTLINSGSFYGELKFVNRTSSTILFSLIISLNRQIFNLTNYLALQ